MSGPSVSRFLRALVVLAVIAVLVACGDSSTSTSTLTPVPSAPDPPAVEATSTAAPTDTPPSVPASSTSVPPGAGAGAGVDIDIDADTLWWDLFDVFAAAEQSCIRDELDGRLLDSVLDRPVLVESSVTDDWEVTVLVTVFSCLAPETARAVFLSITIASIETELETELALGLGDEERACLREWVSGADMAAHFAFSVDPSSDPGEAALLTYGFLECVPDVLLSAEVIGTGWELVGFSVEERACLREWMSGVDWDSLIFTFSTNDPAVIAIVMPGLVECALDALLSAVVMGTGWELAELSVEGRACLREWMSGVDWTAPYPTATSEADHLAAVYEWEEGFLACVMEDAIALTVGHGVEGVLDDGGDVDFFVFEAVEGELYQIDVVRGTLTDSMVTLYDSDGSWLADNDGYDGAIGPRLVWNAGSSGLFYVGVSGYGGLGSYTLIVEHSILIDDYKIGQGVEGVLEYLGDIDFFVFEGVEGEFYEIVVESGTLPYLVVGLFDSDGILLEDNVVDDFSLGPHLVWKAGSSGLYRVGILGNETGSYTLTIDLSSVIDDHADSMVEATGVTVGRGVEGLFEYGGDVDFFVFEGVEGEFYEIVVELGTLSDSVVTLYDSDGLWLADNDDSEGSLASRLVWQAEISGSYYIEVDGHGAGSYMLSVVS